MIHLDQINTQCQKCGEGVYIELSTRDEIEHILHCSECRHRVNRYQNDDKLIEKRLTLME